MILNDMRRELLSEEKIEESEFGDFVRGAQQKVSSGVSSIYDNVRNFLKGIIGSIGKVFMANVKGSSIPSYKANGEIGYLYPSVLVDAQEGSGLTTKSANMAKAFINKGANHATICFDDGFMSNYAASNVRARTTNESNRGAFLNKLLREAQSSDDIENDYSPGAEKESATERKFSASNKSIAAGSTAPSADWLNGKSGTKAFLHTAEINIKTFADIIEEMIFSLHFRTEKTQTVPSLLLQGFPGVGKTALVSQLRKSGFDVTTLEIASIYKEVLGGFPVIENVFVQQKLKKGEPLSEKDINSLSSEDKAKLGEYQKEVHMKAANIFPKENGMRHILFLDEFNRDNDKMAAAMNLILSGSIGSQYYLPLKTMVIASGNLGLKIDSVSVADIDSATFDRFNIKAILPKKMIDGLVYLSQMTNYSADGVKKSGNGFVDTIQPVTEEELKKYNIDLAGLTTSFDIFFSAMVEKYGGSLKDNEGNDPTELKMTPLASQFQDDNDVDEGDNPMKYLFAQRTIDKMNERLKMRILSNWIKAKEGREQLMPVDKSFVFDNQVGNRYPNLKTPEDWEKCYEQYKSDYLGAGITSPADLYIQIIQWHPTFLPTVLKTSVGGKPFRFIDNFRKVVEQAITETNNFSIEDIVFGYFYKRAFGHDGEAISETGKREIQHYDPDQVMKMAKSSVATKSRVAKTYINIIRDYDTPDKIKEMIGKVCKTTYAKAVKKLIDDGKGAKTLKDGSDPVDLLILNFNQYCKDAGFQPNNAAQMIDKFREYGLFYDANKKEVEKNEKSRFKISESGDAILKDFFGSVWRSNKAFQDAMGLKSGQSMDDMPEAVAETADPILTEALAFYKRIEKRGR